MSASEDEELTAASFVSGVSERFVRLLRGESVDASSINLSTPVPRIGRAIWTWLSSTLLLGALAAAAIVIEITRGLVAFINDLFDIWNAFIHAILGEGTRLFVIGEDLVFVTGPRGFIDVGFQFGAFSLDGPEAFVVGIASAVVMVGIITVATRVVL